MGTVLFALLAARLPKEVKLLGLFPLMWGAVAGWGLSCWANECQVRNRSWLFVAVFVLLAAGETGIVCQAWQVYRSDLRQQFARDPSSSFAKQAQELAVKEQQPHQIELSRLFQADAERVQALRRQALGLSTFLNRRLSERGDLSQPLPEIFFACEILLGSACGLVVLSKR